MRAAFVLVALASLAGCTGQIQPLGLGEPIRVHGATLRRSALPGSADATEGPQVTAIETFGGVWQQGQLDRTVEGRVSDDAVAVGLEIPGLGSGWWVLPVGASDPAYPGERGWSALADVGGGLPPGLHRMRVVAIDEAGAGGAWSEIELCVVDPRVPDALNACDPSLPPPDAVIVVEWDEHVDLDLVVVTPEGKTVDERHPTTLLDPPDGEDGRAILRMANVGRLDGDSLAECLPDGRSSESLTFPEPTHAPGTYLIYVNLFDACGHGSARFTVTTYRREQAGEGEYRLARGEQTTGVVLAPSANGGAGQALYVTAVTL